jgi:hypothetical protein
MPEKSSEGSHRPFATSDFLPVVENRISRLDDPDEPLSRDSAVVVADIGARQSAMNPSARKYDPTPLIGASVVVVLLGLCSALIFGRSDPALPGNATAKVVVVDATHNVNLLELDIKGKPYQCRATVDSLATPQIHCEPDGS